VTTTTAASEALARLREVVKPGETLYVTEKRSRSGDTCRMQLRAVWHPEGANVLARLTGNIAQALDLQMAGGDGALVVPGDVTLSDLLDRLSVALFGAPGQIKGEYL